MKKFNLIFLILFALLCKMELVYCQPGIVKKITHKNFRENQDNLIRSIVFKNKKSVGKTRSSLRLIGKSTRNNTGSLIDSLSYLYNNGNYGFVASNSNSSGLVYEYLPEMTVPDLLTTYYSGAFRELPDVIIDFDSQLNITDSTVNSFGANHRLESIYETDFTYSDSIHFLYNSLDNQIQRRWIWRDLNTGPDWNADYREFYAYNLNGQINEIYWQAYDTTMISWVDGWHDSLYYIGNNLMKIQTFVFDSSAMGLVPISKGELVYNSSNYIEKILGYNSIGGVWVENSRTTYGYNTQGKIVSKIEEEVQNGFVMNVIKDSFEYQLSDIPIVQVHYEWDTSVSNWKPDFKRILTLNADDQILSAVDSSWNNNLSQWHPNKTTIFYYGLGSTSVTENKDLNGIEFFPNPSHSGIWVQIDELTHPVDVELISMSGQKILTTRLNERHSFIPMNVAAGIYLLRFQAGDEVFQSRLVVE